VAVAPGLILLCWPHTSKVLGPLPRTAAFPVAHRQFCLSAATNQLEESASAIIRRQIFCLRVPKANGAVTYKTILGKLFFSVSASFQLLWLQLAASFLLGLQKKIASHHARQKKKKKKFFSCKRFLN